jgi:trehalose 6-phosphate phosphatase
MSNSVQASPEATSLLDLLQQAGEIALFLDFDGVIAELAPTPDSVVVAPGMIARLQSLSSALDGALAILSGRDIGALDALLAPLCLPVAGDHGNLRRRGDGRVLVANPEAEAAAEQLCEMLGAQFADDPRIIVEQKPSAVAVHCRLAPERADECIAAVLAAAKEFPALSVICGKMVVEARAKGASKGEALRAFMGEAPFAGRTPICVGDDVTDEDGFAAAQALGGAGIKVGEGKSEARFRIAGTAEVAAMLDLIVRRYGWAR